MSTRSKVSRFFLATTAAALCSCVPPAPEPLRDLGTAMDAMSQREAEWGTMSISAPQLANPGTVFQFSVKEGPEEFLADAKNQIQGRAAEFQQSINSLGLGANISVDTSVALSALSQVQQFQQGMSQSALQQSIQNQKQAAINSAALAQYNQALAAAAKAPDATTQQQMVGTAIQNLQQQMVTASPTTQPFPSLPTPTTAPTNLVSRPTALISQFATPAAGQAFTQFQQLASNPTAPVISDRDALISAAGDNAVKAMFQVLGDPKLGDAFRSKRVLFGVVNVSINPGWRTKRNYAADVAMECSYLDADARASVYDWFVHNPLIPAPLRLRVAIDQGLALPTDRVASKFISDTLARPASLIDPLRKVLGFSPKERVLTIAELSRDDLKLLDKRIGAAAIPNSFIYKPDPTAGPLVSAVAPMTATQNLQLQSSYRNQQEVALQIALQLQLMGQTFAAQAFENYVKNLQQDFATATPDVIANSYSTAGLFGFQVGPQLRAMGQVQAGSYSGPAQTLERQSFPALVIFGFEANDLTPKVAVDDDGTYKLMEKQVSLVSANNWVPTDDRLYGDRSRPSEVERLQLNYWINEYDSKLAFANITPGMSRFVEARVKAFKDRLIGSGCHFSLPQEIITPPTHPKVLHIEPAVVEGGTADPITVLLAGQDLTAIELTQIQLASGGAIEPDTAQMVGNSISIKVALDRKSPRSPLIFQLPTLAGDTVYTDPTLVYITGHPSVHDITPNTLTLGSNPGADRLTATVALAGENLDRINLSGISATCDCVCVDGKNARIYGKNVIVLGLSAPTDAHAFALKLPLQNGSSDDFILSPPVTLETGSLAIEHQTATNKNTWSNERLVFPRGTTLGTLQAVLGQSKATTTSPNGQTGGKPATDVAPAPAGATPAPAGGAPAGGGAAAGSGAASASTYNTSVIVNPTAASTANNGAPASAADTSAQNKPSAANAGAADPATQPAVASVGPTTRPCPAPAK